jgi:hypothetical protein
MNKTRYRQCPHGPSPGRGQTYKHPNVAQAAYYDKPGFATKDATRVGRLHTFLPGECRKPALGLAVPHCPALYVTSPPCLGWLEANVAFMRSGGYSVSTRIKEVRLRALWGHTGKHESLACSSSLAKKTRNAKANPRMILFPRGGSDGRM